MNLFKTLFGRIGKKLNAKITKQNTKNAQREWCNHPIATVDDEILEKILQCLGKNSAEYNSTALVCKAWNKSTTNALKDKNVYNFSTCSDANWDINIITMPPDLQDAHLKSCFEANIADVLKAARMPTFSTFYPLNNGFFVVGNESGEIIVYSSRIGRPLLCYRRSIPNGVLCNVKSLAVSHISFSADGTWGCVCYVDGLFAIFRPTITNGRLDLNYMSFTYMNFHKCITWSEFIPNSNKIIVCCSCVNVSNYSFNPEEPFENWEHTPGAVISRCTPDGLTTATLTEKSLHIHNIATQTELYQMSVYGIEVIDWSPHGAKLLVGSNKVPSFVFNLETLSVQYTASKQPFPLCWSLDGKSVFFPTAHSAWRDVDEWLDGCGVLITDDDEFQETSLFHATASHNRDACVFILKDKRPVVIKPM